MNQLTAILKQHTPMIHFQHNESGATLRASEVKPLLDKFILTKLGNGDIREGRLYACLLYTSDAADDLKV